jgi:hypothetical protein
LDRRKLAFCVGDPIEQDCANDPQLHIHALAAMRGASIWTLLN